MDFSPSCRPCQLSSRQTDHFLPHPHLSPSIFCTLAPLVTAVGSGHSHVSAWLCSWRQPDDSTCRDSCLAQALQTAHHTWRGCPHTPMGTIPTRRTAGFALPCVTIAYRLPRVCLPSRRAAHLVRTAAACGRLRGRAALRRTRQAACRCTHARFTRAGFHLADCVVSCWRC